MLTVSVEYDSNYSSPDQTFTIRPRGRSTKLDWNKVMYGSIVCTEYAANEGANFYLDMDRNDPGNCPPLGMFKAGVKARISDKEYKKYTGPVWGYEKNVYDEYGKVIVRQDGECSWLVDTGVSYDFQIPCKAHDYCYDMIRAGFSGTVTDPNCDYEFEKLMTAHCEGREENVTLCRFFRNQAYRQVTEDKHVVPRGDDPVVPGKVRLYNQGTRSCAAVVRTVTRKLITYYPLQQQGCGGTTSNNIFYLYPAPDPEAGEYSYLSGYFQIRPASSALSGKCLARTAAEQYQLSNCRTTLASQRFKISGDGNIDQYHIKDSSNYCWKVSGQGNGEFIRGMTCSQTDKKSFWRIDHVD